MTYATYAAPSTEPVTIAEVMAHLRLDQSNQEPAPGAVTVALASMVAPGNCTNGAHRVLATFVTADGETQSGAVSGVVTVADNAVNGQIAVTAIPIGGSTVTARKIYMTAAGGSTYYLAATVANNTATTATINVADGSLGVQAPTTNTTSDPEITRMIRGARSRAELLTKRWLVTQTIDAYFDAFPVSGIINLPPLQSVSEITYLDSAGATQTLAADQYVVDAISTPARITQAYSVTWPLTRCQTNAIKVRFIAGYGAAAAVPDGIKDWMLVRIASKWDQREAMTVAKMNELPRDFIDGLLDEHIAFGL